MPANQSRNRRERRHPELIGLTEAAERCDVNYRTIRRWIAAGRLKAVRVGPRLLKVDAAQLDAMMQPLGGDA
ncbi:MAG: helix-turn-helix domain-containing protein [Mycolicibacter algericus]|uniref:excisionase family DNA-binding protein n=1 Tax=Mycolicibacter algericus TaxID=1288388 RepID=UPI003C71AA28